MEHLFSSVVRVERLQLTNVGGDAQMTWSQAEDEDEQLQEMLERLHCRLDLNFVRPGKDIPAAPVAGRAPDRIGVMFTYGYAPIRAGDRVVAIPDDFGNIVVPGTFELRVIPDKALDYDSAHHIEVQILETNQAMDKFYQDDGDEE